MAYAKQLAAIDSASAFDVGELLARLELRLAEVAGSPGKALERYSSATMRAGGKRLRPLLVFISGDSPTVDEEALLTAATAIELVHCATLVHDDVFDAAPLRRGKPTVVATAGRLIATATGDFLFAQAFAQLRQTANTESLRVLSSACSALADGELLQRAGSYDVTISEQTYLRRCELKTGRLFRAACELGALSSGGPAAELAQFGCTIGIAFQLLDDVLDICGPAARTGKQPGTDLLDGTVTLPFILARQRDRRLAELDLSTLETEADAAAVCSIIKSTAVLDEVRQRAIAMVADAKQQLPNVPDRQRALLELVADATVERYA